MPKRKDWDFTFKDTNIILKKSTARVRVHIAGDKIEDSNRFIHIPEEWSREYTNQKTIYQSIENFCSMFQIFVFLAGIVGAIIYRSKFPYKRTLLMKLFGFLLIIQLLAELNTLPGSIAQFSTDEPFWNQFFTSTAEAVASSLGSSLIFAYIIIFIFQWKKSSVSFSGKRGISVGVAVGLWAAIIPAITAQILSPKLPFWAKFDPADTFMPMLGSMLSSIRPYLMQTIIALLILIAIDRWSLHWSRNKISAAVIFIVVGILFSGDKPSESIPEWILLGILNGIFLLASYYFVFRCNMALVPIAIAGIYILQLLHQGILQAYPFAFATSIIAIFFLGIFSYFWSKELSNPFIAVEK